MRFEAILMLLAMVLMTMAGPALATGLGGTGPCMARNAMEVYCVNHGGCPNNGNCYFPDGSYCNLRSFYNGTCPGRGYYENAMWMAEAYRFLNEDESPYSGSYPGSYPAYTSGGYPYYSYPYFNYPYYNYYYGSTPSYYAPGYGQYWPMM